MIEALEMRSPQYCVSWKLGCLPLMKSNSVSQGAKNLQKDLSVKGTHQKMNSKY